MEMRFLSGLRATVGIYFLFGCSVLVRGQLYEDPTMTFSKFAFDTVHRGSFNISDCVKELINCWEIIKADWVCTYGIKYESPCGMLRRDCSAAEGWTNPDLAPIHEGFCDHL